ncbi:MAG: DUF2490 domain-containing protein [Gammaproteobacteria bacterium]|nr:DUF2490 domain-containing protein [Gammaproteobacteria bacterium]
MIKRHLFIEQFLKRFFQIKISLSFLLASITLFVSVNSFALNQYAKQWFAVNLQHALDKNKKWHSFLYSQLRTIDRTHPLESGLLEGGIGYQLTADENIWIGYRWTGKNPYNDFYQENRVFQQIISQKQLGLYRFILRTRLEEITRSDTRQIALRLRERLAIDGHRQLWRNTSLFAYDEVFFQLNHPAFITSAFLGENRLFLGFNIRISKETWWEIGYINQYQVRTPQQNQNQMSHILSITYNFLD